ncbi:hypothetical protein DOE57_09520 [Salmonella enterica subsp. salamae serovar 56:b:[1,5]]|uniref:WbuO protein n=1 Tax=Salmonella enterica subsp. salamae serovar 56:b:[1,5] TaxID=2577858 RepID=A0A6C7CX17_SALER|nr:hypothetical protein [Salmonella enterica]AXC85536.1 hypothetical protein DOE57_09520 [Salmonella enterica subsp. salamae serovar 56:b:[1,5]]KSB59258.1 hypothetical protein LFZ48_17025 [Salmonella enterica subsp. salamae serovar 56:z10:e,n,x str. 1369-73]HCM1964516.1 hypothetical protein [Salmonella enterica subsp. salamae serovar 56:l,v:z39]HCM2050232.1 hypothetical protein [Salmonella enterica subsp. salamae serovar 56:z10:e,n,x]
MIFYYIPLLYLLHTRLKSIPEMLSWGGLYLFSIIYLCSPQFDVNNILYTFLVIVFIYAFYEIGYIFNDAVLIKKEKTPTLRLSHLEIEYLILNLKTVLFVRLFIASVLLLIFYYVGMNYFKAIACGTIILLIYYFYNRTRSNLSAILYYLLISTRFFTPFLILNIDIPFWLFVMQPMLATLEYAGKKQLFNDCFKCFIKHKIYTRFFWYLAVSFFMFIAITYHANFTLQDIFFVALSGLTFRGAILIRHFLSTKLK